MTEHLRIISFGEEGFYFGWKFEGMWLIMVVKVWWGHSWLWLWRCGGRCFMSGLCIFIPGGLERREMKVNETKLLNLNSCLPQSNSSREAPSPKGSTTFQVVPLAGDQVLKNMNLWKAFYTKTSTLGIMSVPGAERGDRNHLHVLLKRHWHGYLKTSEK